MSTVTSKPTHGKLERLWDHLSSLLMNVAILVFMVFIAYLLTEALHF
jgi:hypothetical protein